MDEANFKPNDVQLVGMPLTGTMEKAEIEAMAALVVRVCQVDGDTWKPVTPARLAEVIRADYAAKYEPFASLARNSFWRPDLHAFIASEFGAAVDDGKRIEALRRWVRFEWQSELHDAVRALLALALMAECGRDETLKVDLIMRCTGALEASQGDEPARPTIAYAPEPRDVWSTVAALADRASKTQPIHADAAELAALWACFFACAIGKVDRLGVAVTRMKEGFVIAYVVLKEAALAPWLPCVRNDHLPKGVVAFDPVALAGGHAKPVDWDAWGRSTVLLWLTEAGTT